MHRERGGGSTRMDFKFDLIGKDDPIATAAVRTRAVPAE
jgi:hypothetical protein